MNNLTEEQIRTADPEQISEWVADRRGLKPRSYVTIEMFGEHRPVWSNADPWKNLDDSLEGYEELPAASGDGPGVDGDPPPFATEWWAAGPLLEELELRARKEEETVQDYSPMLQVKHNPKWEMRGWVEIDHPRRSDVLRAPYTCIRSIPPEAYVSGESGLVKGKGTTAPEAIARAWLLAYERGLLEATDAE